MDWRPASQPVTCWGRLQEAIHTGCITPVHQEWVCSGEANQAARPFVLCAARNRGLLPEPSKMTSSRPTVCLLLSPLSVTDCSLALCIPTAVCQRAPEPADSTMVHWPLPLMRFTLSPCDRHERAWRRSCVYRCIHAAHCRGDA